MNETNTPASGGIGFFGLLTIVFIILKLVDKIDWPWFWVLSPMIIPAAIAVFIVIIMLIVAVVSSLFES